MLISRQQDQPLSVADGARLRLHLAVCDACRNVAKQLAFIRRAVRQLSEDQGPKP